MSAHRTSLWTRTKTPSALRFCWSREWWQPAMHSRPLQPTLRTFYPSAVGTINIAGFRARKNHRQRPVLCIMRHQLAIKTRQYVAIRIIAEGRAANLPWRMCRLTVTAIAAVLYVTGVVIEALLDTYFDYQEYSSDIGHKQSVWHCFPLLSADPRISRFCPGRKRLSFVRRTQHRSVYSRTDQGKSNNQILIE